MDYDVFNGDADGIISLVQLRLAGPRPEAALVTGRKRRIDLLSGLDAKAGDNVTVLDVSMRTNAQDLRRILDAGAHVFYADHHNAGDIPKHKNLTAIIDTSPEICTAMLIDTHLGGKYRAWAVTAAFGDNFPELAKRKAEGLDLPLPALERLGMLVNYNGYGASVDDLHFHPAELYRALADYDTPMAFMTGQSGVVDALENGYESDLDVAKQAIILEESDTGLVLGLPDKAAARRISGVYGNQLAQDNPQRAHAILTAQPGGYLVSIRAPLAKRTGADRLALTFKTGGGRAAAAGINHLPEEDLEYFIDMFSNVFVR